MKPKTIYLDYAATTPVDPRVLKSMMPYFQTHFGNTMSIHHEGKKSAQALEDSRALIARFIHAKSDEIYFTSSSTESNNTVLKGVALANRSKGKHIIISSIEHDCISESAKFLEKEFGFEITRLPVEQNGLINLNTLEKSIRPDTLLVSMIHANNEIGTIQDIESIGKICHSRGVYFHTDASQSFSQIPLDVQKMNIDLLTASSHKIYGPKGVACLYVREGVNILPLLHGGGHERGLRSSTVNTPLIVGFAKAVSLLQKNILKESIRLTYLRDKAIKGILSSIPGSRLNGHPIKRLPNNINISFSKVEGESLMLQLDMNGIECSTGSACSSNSLEPSHVLLAIGLSPIDAHGSLRFSLGRWTKESDIDTLLQILPKVVNKFRILSPFKI